MTQQTADAIPVVTSNDNSSMMPSTHWTESPPMPSAHIDLATLNNAPPGVVQIKPSAAEYPGVLNYVAGHSPSRKPVPLSPDARQRQAFAPSLTQPISPTSRLHHCQHRLSVEEDAGSFAASVISVPRMGGGIRRSAAAGAVMRLRLAENAREARRHLEQALVDVDLPTHRKPNAALAGFKLFFFWRAYFNCLPESDGGKLLGSVVRMGGPAQIRFLLSVAESDANGDGEIDDYEWQLHESQGEQKLNGLRALSDTTSVVCTLMLGLTHLVTIGRPVPYELSPRTEETFGFTIGQALVWTAYGCNVLSEVSALMTLIVCFSTRYFLLMVLPTLESKIEWVQRTRPIIKMTYGYSCSVWFFSLSLMFGGIVASPDFGFLAVGIMAILAWAAACVHSQMYLQATFLLVEEVKNVLHPMRSRILYVEEGSTGWRNAVESSSGGEKEH
mmetsp:Transcript_14278/g.27862  ORF Transcript_14278/g.27862 Transcript_14278/m.27862 type:complete len:444 (+) Transcript_14278:420-1751(+)